MKYQLISAFEAGTGGDVYLMKDIEQNTNIVVKTSFDVKEVEILNKISDLGFTPNFARVESRLSLFDESLAEHSTIAVMQYIPGENLEKAIELGMDHNKLIECLSSLPPLFKKIYDKGVIHGDINWNNIRIFNDKIYVIDFGESILSHETDENTDFKQIVWLYQFVKSLVDSPIVSNLADINYSRITSYQQLHEIVLSITSGFY